VVALAAAKGHRVVGDLVRRAAGGKWQAVQVIRVRNRLT
jgi:hypothetical protein